jgi:hypothetical protein
MPFSAPQDLEVKVGADATLTDHLTYITKFYGGKTYKISTGWSHPELRHTFAHVTDSTLEAKSQKS